jgi:hypothetical protein
MTGLDLKYVLKDVEREVAVARARRCVPCGSVRAAFRRLHEMFRTVPLPRRSGDGHRRVQDGGHA